MSVADVVLWAALCPLLSDSGFDAGKSSIICWSAQTAGLVSDVVVLRRGDAVCARLVRAGRRSRGVSGGRS